MEILRCKLQFSLTASVVLALNIRFLSLLEIQWSFWVICVRVWHRKLKDRERECVGEGGRVREKEGEA